MDTNKVTLLRDKVRRDVLDMLRHRGYGHMGGSLSLVETFAVLYGSQMHYDPEHPKMEDRDLVVLSKGHAGPVWYSTLAESGFFDKDWLYTLNEGHTNLPSHPDRLKTPGVDMTTGSLGQGTSTATGLALAQKRKGIDRNTYLIVGDGELNEGQCWEAFQYIAANGLDNLILLVDENKKQLDGPTKDVMNPFDIAKKLESFGFSVETVNGADVEAIDQAITRAKEDKGVVHAIVLDTIKGQGVPYFETLDGNHSVKFNNEAIHTATDAAIRELDERIKEGEEHVQAC